MDDTSFSPRSEELSAEDLAIIQAFDATDDLVIAGNLDEQQLGMQSGSLPLEKGGPGAENPEDMLMLFASEADEDIATMRRALQDLEQDNQRTSPGLVTLGRAAHKLKGTAGAMGCEAMSAIALQIEEELHLVRDGKVVFLTGVMALVHAINALEATLKSVLESGQENPQPLQELLQDMGKLNVPSEQLAAQEISPSRSAPSVADAALPPLVPQLDSRNLHTLISHTEHLVELNTSLQSVQKQISKSLMELQAAHGRLRHLEGLISNMAFPGLSGSEAGQSSGDHPSSSLVARILLRGGRQQRSRPTPPSITQPGLPAESALWDEMEMDRFTEHKILLQSFSEAVADVATASSQLRAAFAQLNTLLDQQASQTMAIRDDTLRLRSVPFNILLARVQQIIQELAQKHNRPIQLEVKGETIELDQDILEALAEPFLNMIRANVTDSLLSTPPPPLQEPDRIWLQAQAVGNEIVIELGFSMPIPGGALEALRAPIQQLHGSIAARRNPSGGVLYQLRFPRTQGLVQGLLVQAGGQGLILPLVHIDLIDYKHQEPSAQVYNLAALLGFPQQTGSAVTAPAILLAGSQRRVALQVDEIIGEVELITKPLDKHLQRPGIVGTAVDGSGNVLLIVDLPALVRYGFIQRSRAMFKAQSTATSIPAQTASTQSSAPAVQQAATILVADDSVYIRQSLRQTFERAGYEVIEARDGIEALEYLSSDQPPAVMLLDIEMPNLNGYDLLNILHSRPGFADCKTILLTSRSSEKHRQRAMELGAYAFLGKPCAQDVLLDTVFKALADMPAPG